MKIVNFTAVLYDVRIKRDGGGRLQLDFGSDSFESLIEVQRFFKDNAISVAVALAPYKEGMKEGEVPIEDNI